MKRVLSAILAVAMVLSLIVIPVYGADAKFDAADDYTGLRFEFEAVDEVEMGWATAESGDYFKINIYVVTAEGTYYNYTSFTADVNYDNVKLINTDNGNTLGESAASTKWVTGSDETLPISTEFKQYLIDEEGLSESGVPEVTGFYGDYGWAEYTASKNNKTIDLGVSQNDKGFFRFHAAKTTDGLYDYAARTYSQGGFLVNSIYFKITNNNLSLDNISFSDIWTVSKARLYDSTTTQISSTENENDVLVADDFPGDVQPVDVTFTVSDFGSGSDAVSMSGATVEIKSIGEVGVTGSGHTYDKTFTVTSDGKLQAENETAVSTLSLEVGSYTWTLTPPSGSEETCTSNTGYFTVAAKTPLTVSLSAAAISNITYTLKLLDNQGGYVKNSTVSIAVDGSAKTVSYDPDTGVATFTATDGTRQLTIGAEGYDSRTLTVTLGAGAEDGDGGQTGVVSDTGAADGGVAAVVLFQKTASVKLTVGDNANTVVKLKAAGDDTVTSAMAAKMPLIAAVADGAATFEGLADGVYAYTVTVPGSEDLTGKLIVNVYGLQSEAVTAANSAVGVFVTVDGTDGSTALTLTDGVYTDNGTAVATPTAVTDPLYYVVGTWLQSDGTTVAGEDDEAAYMKLAVYVQNTSALEGTFGVTYDTNILGGGTDAEVTVTPAETVVIEQIQLKDSKNTVLSNPCVGTDYVLFQWAVDPNAETGTENDEGYMIALGGDSPSLVATITLPVNGDHTKADEGTVTELDFSAGQWVLDIAGSGLADPDAFAVNYWRACDDANGGDAAWPRLSADLAATTGFYQTFSTAEADETGLTVAQDTRSQFVYELFNQPEALKFAVVNQAGAAVPNAAVAVYDNADLTGTPIGTATTDENGEASVELAFPGDATDVYWVVTAGGYKTRTGSTLAEMLGAIQNVELESDTLFAVKLHEDNANLQLTGGTAHGGEEYRFTLSAAAGYDWTDPHDASKLTIQILADGKENWDADATGNLNVTWSAAENCYIIPANQIVTHAVTLGETEEDLTWTVVIKVAVDESEIDVAEGFKVTVTVGEKGTVNFDPNGNGSTFAYGSETDATDAPEGALTGAVEIVETLKVETDETSGAVTIGTTSASYTFIPAEYDGNKTTVTEDHYMAYVISSFKVNGSEMTLDDYHRIVGVSGYVLSGIDADQSVVVVFAEATVNDNGTPDDQTDDFIEDETPLGDAVVTVILSEYADASGVKVNNNEVTEGTALTGATSANYSVSVDDAAGTFEATFAGRASEAEGGTSYEIDVILVDGAALDLTATSAEGAEVSWTVGDDGAVTVTLSGLTAGATHTITVTAKVKDSEVSMAAVLDVVLEGANGSVSPIGVSTRTAGIPETVTMIPAEGYQLASVYVTEGDGETVNVTDQAVYDEESGAWTYETPALQGGVTTTVTVRFETSADNRFEVSMQVSYSGMANNLGTAKDATFTFVNADDGERFVYGPDEAGSYALGTIPAGSSAKEYRFSLPVGSWTVTITRKGYLDRTISGFVIQKDEGETLEAGYLSGGALVKTKVADETVTSEGGAAETVTVIYFGQSDGDDTAQTAVTLTNGDATWDGRQVALNDTAQVANGLRVGRTAAQIARADLNNDGKATVADMVLVTENFGKESAAETYANFMTPTAGA